MGDVQICKNGRWPGVLPVQQATRRIFADFSPSFTLSLMRRELMFIAQMACAENSTFRRTLRNKHKVSAQHWDAYAKYSTSLNSSSAPAAPGGRFKPRAKRLQDAPDVVRRIHVRGIKPRDHGIESLPLILGQRLYAIAIQASVNE